MNIETFINELKKHGVELTETQQEQFEIYFRELVKWNDKINLTAITEKEEVYLKHFFDSITPSFDFDYKSINTICDIGAGAGFPSLPLKIVYPHLRITIIDSLDKRINFLNNLCNSLGIEDVECIHGRAEVLGKERSHTYDICMARAVARLNVLSELCIPFVKKGGYFISLKGSKVEEEVLEAEKGISELGCKLINRVDFKLPGTDDNRSNLYYFKENNTPDNYPRSFNRIKKKPL